MTEPEQFDPEIVAVLDAIDATLAGEAVDPRHADLAELALLLADERPQADAAFAARLDERVERRFEPAPRVGRRRVAWPVWAPSAAVAISLIVAVVIVLGQGGGSSGTSSGRLDATAASSASKATPAPARHGPVNASPGTLAPRLQTVRARRSANATSAAGPAGPPVAGPRAPVGPVYAPHTVPLALTGPSTAGRKVIQGAQLSLSTTARRVDQVAQEVFNVVGQQRGIVKSSQVTATGGSGGEAEFQLSVPDGNLAATMTALSSLQFASVLSRTDTSQDVTNQFQVDQRRLADDRALRTALLKQLASAVTPAQVDSLNARIHDAETAISSDENGLHAINRSVGYSQVYVTINAGAGPGPVHHGGGGFTVGRAAHDAGHVLTVAAGVALIGLAGLLPLALILALVWWIYAALRRRSRLQVLDQI